MRRAVYTVLLEGYDTLPRPVHAEPELDYIAFCDTESAPPAPWQHRAALSKQRNPRMTARWHKMHPHLLLADYDESLYIDANVFIKDRVGALFTQTLQKSCLALFRHAARNCVYDEAEAVKQWGLDDGAIVDAQMAYYRAHGLPRRAGLYYTGVLFRRHRDPQLVDFLEDWWRQLKVFSHRDQLSFGFLLKRHGIVVDELPGENLDNPWFAVGPHRRSRIDLAAGLAPAEADEVDWLRAALVAASSAAPTAPETRRDTGQSIFRRAKAPLSMLKQRALHLRWNWSRARHYRGKRDQK